MTWSGKDWLNLTCAAILGASGVGFVIGLHGNARIHPATLQTQHRPVFVDQIPHAVVYADLGKANVSVNADWTNRLDKLVQQRPARTDPVPPQRVEDTVAAVLQRSQRRAYAGAPPVIPHGVGTQRSAADCLICHEKGMDVGGRIASVMSHPRFQNCTQCHVESANGVLGDREMAVNVFQGLAEPVAGQRANDQAPPTMPHSSHMREDCASCHGPLGRPGLRTTHPERSNCVQCHPASAALDQWQALSGGPR